MIQRPLNPKRPALAEIEEALESGPGHPAYTSFVLAEEEAGKADLIARITELAEQRGWVVISESASTPGVIARICVAAARELKDVGVITGELFRELAYYYENNTETDSYTPNFRELLTLLGIHSQTASSGVLLIVNDIEAFNLLAFTELGSVIQHVTRREENPVALLMAGLPSADKTLLTPVSVGVLQRCPRFYAGELF